MVNINVSNGTCYSAQQTETQGDFIPCGNIALGNWPCCAVGDVCLGFETANACYDYDSGNSYIAGCTDATYGDATCPQKLGFGDQEWVAIDHCGTDSQGNTEWGGCRNTPVNDTQLTKLANSMCSPYCASTTLWVGGATIEAYATVPTIVGGSIIWTNDFNPATTTRAAGTIAATTTGASGMASSTSTPTSISTETPQANNSSGLDTGAKIGIGIGSAGAALLVIAVVLLSLLVRRRRKKRTMEVQGGPQQPALVEVPPYAAGGYPSQWNDPTNKPPCMGAVNMNNNHNGSQMGFKFELPAESQWQPGPSPHPSSATTASPHFSTVSPDHASVSHASTMVPGKNGSGYYVSPQSTGTPGYQGHSGHGESGPVSELQG